MAAQDSHELTRLQRITYRVWLTVGILLLSGAALYVLARPLAVIVPPVLVAGILVYLLNPVVTGLARLRVPRLLGTLLALLLFAGVLAGAGALLAPPFVEQVSMFAETAPEIGAQISDRVSGWLAGIGINVDLDAGFEPGVTTEQAQEFLSDADARSTLLALMGGLGGLFTGMFNLVLALIVGPFTAAYLLWDLPRVQAWAHGAIPPDYRDEVAQVSRRLSDVVGGFIRGQLLVAAYVGVATSLGLGLIGLRFWLVLGLVAGVANVVPLIGPFVAGLLGVLVALFTGGPGLAVAVVVVMTIVQQGDNQLVSPLVMGRTVRLHPLVVLLALTVAGVLYGILGLIIAIPAVAAANVLGAHLWRTRVPWGPGSPEYEAPAAQDGDAPAQPGIAEPATPYEPAGAAVPAEPDEQAASGPQEAPGQAGAGAHPPVSDRGARAEPPRPG